jgi:hypothetical protein
MTTVEEDPFPVFIAQILEPLNYVTRHRTSAGDALVMMCRDTSERGPTHREWAAHCLRKHANCELAKCALAKSRQIRFSPVQSRGRMGLKFPKTLNCHLRPSDKIPFMKAKEASFRWPGLMQSRAILITYTAINDTFRRTSQA